MKIWGRLLAFILVLMVVFTIAPMQVFADDIDDLPPLIPSDMDQDSPNYLPPLIPTVHEGKEPPTKPPIEIEVPEDGRDLDLKPPYKDIFDEQGYWVIRFEESTLSGPQMYMPDTVTLSASLQLTALKLDAKNIFGTYNATATYNWYEVADKDWWATHKCEVDDFQITLFDPSTVTDEDIENDVTEYLVPSGLGGLDSNFDDKDYLEPLVPGKYSKAPVIYGVGTMPYTVYHTSGGENYTAPYPEPVQNLQKDITIYIYRNGIAKLIIYAGVVDGYFTYTGKLSRVIAGGTLG